ncbi:MAG: transporter substrate-binding domain-containing protein, partial [Myxococcaceae bacterium]|nr:transporter substrate-binding domain-containing protein [Myxococcaceae bacterium]
MRWRWNRAWLLLAALTLAAAVLVLPRITPRSGPTVSLTPEEREWLRRHGDTVVLAPYSGGPPFSFVNELGEFIGMAADYTQLLEKKLGIRFHVLPPAPVDDVLRGVREGRVDVTVLMAESPERAEFLAFTEPLVSSPVVILVRRGTWDSLSLEQLRGLKVAVGRGFALEDFLTAQHPPLHLTLVKDDVEGLRRLATGEVDVVLADIATASYIITDEHLPNLRIAGDVPFRYHLAMGARRDEPLLLGILRKGVGAITERERRDIWERWVVQWERPFYMDASFWRFVAVLVTGVGLLVGAVVLWNLTLKRQVRARTAELSEANRRVAFLAESGVFLSESLDYELTFARLGELLVREMCDWCVMAVVEGGQLLRVGWAHADSTKRPLLEELVTRFPARPGDAGPSGQVLTDGKPHVAPELSEEDLLVISRNNELHAALFRAVGTRTALAVPLIARGQMLGMLTLASGVPGRHYGQLELELAQEVARRAAIAIDNARLYEQAQAAVRARDLFLTVAAHELRT